MLPQNNNLMQLARNFPANTTTRKTALVLGFRSCFAIGSVKSSVALAGGATAPFPKEPECDSYNGFLNSKIDFREFFF